MLGNLIRVIVEVLGECLVRENGESEQDKSTVGLSAKSTTTT